MPIRWDDLEPQAYEKMVSVLLSRLYPDAQRIDGRGGDGGRDVQIVGAQDDRITEAFELKSFIGRMESGRRKQVEHSLKRAATLGPAKWTLVVPIDPTPSEDSWFRKLKKTYPFPMRWYGRTWLDEKMSSHPDIRRYYLDGAAHEVVRLLRELREEQATVTNVQDAVGRLGALHGRLNEIDPHYRYELSTGSTAADGGPTGSVFSVSFGDVRVDAYPKYLGATRDRPIAMNLKLDVGPEDGMVLEALNYGMEVTIPPRMVGSVTVDAPSGLGGDFTEAELVLIPINSLDEPVTLALDIMDGDRLVANWPVLLTERTEGVRGCIVTGTDSTGWLQTRLKVDVETKELEAKFWLTPQPTMPAALVPFFQWLDACRPPHHLRFRWQVGSELRSQIQEHFIADDSLGRVVDALAYLQNRCGIHWEMSPSLTSEEGQQILTAATLLKEETTDFTWESWNLRLDNWEPVLKKLMDGYSRPIRAKQDVRIELEGVTVATIRTQIDLEYARVSNLRAVQRALKSGKVPHLRLIPGKSDKAHRTAILLPSPPEDPCQ